MAIRPIEHPNVAISAEGMAIIRKIAPLLMQIDLNFIELYSAIGGISAIETQLFSDGTNNFRIQVRDGALKFDEAKTELGFDGIEDTDWENLYSMQILVTP